MSGSTQGRPHKLDPGIVIIATCILLVCCNSVYALNPSLHISQYSHNSWKVRDGFSREAPETIAQTPDGYLWLGTASGLLRFDGIRNVPWQPPSDQQLPSNSIMSLLAAGDGSLWIGTSKGLARWKDGKLTQYSELDRQFIFKILEDHEGTIWASGIAVTTGRLCAIRNTDVHCDGDDGSLGRGAFNLFEDSKGNLWAGVKDGLWRFRPGPPNFYPLAGEPNGIRAIGEDVDGTLLVGWNGGMYRLSEGRAEAYPLSGITGKFSARRILRDHDGGLWIGTSSRGLVHAYHGKADVLGNSEGLSSDTIYDLFEDREENIWVATVNGLSRFRESAVATFGRNEGLMNPVVWSVLAARDGRRTPRPARRWSARGLARG